MNVIIESQENDEIVIIDNFFACEDGTDYDSEKEQEFKIGDVVYFVDFYENEDIPGRYDSWMVKFRTKDGRIFSAIQTMFVTLEIWEEIEQFFKEKLGK